MIRKAQKVAGEISGLVTVADAAKHLGVTSMRVLQFIRDDRLKATKLSAKMYLVDADDLQRFSKIPRDNGRPKKK